MTPEEIAKQVENQLRYKAISSHVDRISEMVDHNRKEISVAIASAIADERARIFSEVSRLQQEACDHLERLGGEPLMKVKDRFKMANRQAWLASFDVLTRLKWFIDPSKAPTSEIQSTIGDDAAVREQGLASKADRLFPSKEDTK